jgi:two-component system sensor histidine kinase KdpD
MMGEGRRRRERGEDVVVAAVRQAVADIQQLLREHETIPTLRVAGKDVIDISRICRRRPQVVIIDGLAYDNPAGSSRKALAGH